jgi:hypothetical protein
MHHTFASAILGTLIIVECRFGMMFILLSSGRRLCFNCILFVALILILSGSTKNLLGQETGVVETIHIVFGNCAQCAACVQYTGSVP